jgi:GTPase SAR1 family protein
MFNNKEVLYDLVCWDIGANIYDRTVLPSYFRNAMGVIYVYDISRRETFEKL